MEEIFLAVRAETWSAATDAARAKVPPDAMLLAWYDRMNHVGGPDGPGEASEPYLDTYARSRGARAKVVVDGRFVLFFVPGLVDA